MKIVAIIPALNEEKTIVKVLNGVKSFVDHIIMIDDGSDDNTYQVVKSNSDETIVLRHCINLGKGAALKTGCEAAVKLGADIIICIDADDQHKPEDIPLLVKEINDGFDIVFGSRVMGEKMPIIKLMGNNLLSILIRKLFKIDISDTQSGFRAFTSRVYEKIKWESRDYAVETEMIIRAAKNHLKYTEISIDTIYHDRYKGTTPIHGMSIFFKILKWKLL